MDHKPRKHPGPANSGNLPVEASRLDQMTQPATLVHEMRYLGTTAIFATIGILTCFSGILKAGEPAVGRLWTGLNGKSFRGTIHGISADSAKVQIMTADGKLASVEVGKLIQSDRDYLSALDDRTPAPAVEAIAGETPEPISRSAGPAWEFPLLELPEVPPAPFQHEWKLKDGRTLVAVPEGRKDGKVILKSSKGVKASLAESELTDEDQVRFKFWEATSVPVDMPRLDLAYRLTTSTRGSFDVKISTFGTFGRVEFAAEHSSLVYDVADGAFLWTISYPKKDGTLGAPRTQWGRFEKNHILPAGENQDGAILADREFVKRGIERSTAGKLAAFPSRNLTYPFPAWDETVANLKFDYIRINQLTALAGLYHFLDTTPPGKQISDCVFSHKSDISGHGGFRQHMEMMGRARMLPIRMEWANSAGRSNNPETQKITQGAFSLELVSASIPTSKQAGDFDIPAETRTMPTGSLKKDAP